MPGTLKKPGKKGLSWLRSGSRGSWQGAPESPVARLPLFNRHFPFFPENLYWGLVVGSQNNVVSPTPAPRSPSEPVPQAPALWIETTAYGLLHLLLREGKGEMADKAASWLTHQGSFAGAFRSTQVGAAAGLWAGGRA